jgi:hypothetical protein
MRLRDRAALLVFALIICAIATLATRRDEIYVSGGVDNVGNFRTELREVLWSSVKDIVVSRPSPNVKVALISSRRFQIGCGKDLSPSIAVSFRANDQFSALFCWVVENEIVRHIIFEQANVHRFSHKASRSSTTITPNKVNFIEVADPRNIELSNIQKGSLGGKQRIFSQSVSVVDSVNLALHLDLRLFQSPVTSIQCFLGEFVRMPHLSELSVIDESSANAYNNQNESQHNVGEVNKLGSAKLTGNPLSNGSRFAISFILGVVMIVCSFGCFCMVACGFEIRRPALAVWGALGGFGFFVAAVLIIHAGVTLSAGRRL